jgi:hypothetical protein
LNVGYFTARIIANLITMVLGREKEMNIEHDHPEKIELLRAVVCIDPIFEFLKTYYPIDYEEIEPQRLERVLDSVPDRLPCRPAQCCSWPV